MLRLLSEIIDAATSSEAYPSLQSRQVRLRHLIRECLGVVEPLAAQKDLLLSFNVAPDIPDTVSIDHLRVKQVLVNLLANAIRFTDAGRVEISVNSVDSIDPHQLFLRFDVQDTGVGLTKTELVELLACISCGKQAPRSGVRRGGSGLGLATCQSILQAMDSGLDIESSPRSGTKATFTVRV
jgi:signal transduction histidine kinase